MRAAVDMREALSGLNDELERDFGVRIEARTGVNTGEVVAGEGQTLALGDAVNTAARLKQAAAPGEILLGDSTSGSCATRCAPKRRRPWRRKARANPSRRTACWRSSPAPRPSRAAWTRR